MTGISRCGGSCSSHLQTARIYCASLLSGHGPRTGCTRMCRKPPELDLALLGKCTAHHGRLSRGELQLFDLLDRQIAEHDEQRRDAMPPCAPWHAHLRRIPGVEETTTRASVAELGTDMRRCGSIARLAFWTGRCPAKHESVGKRRRGRTCTGNRYPRRVLVQDPGMWAHPRPPHRPLWRQRSTVTPSQECPCACTGDPIHPYHRICTLTVIGASQGWRINPMRLCVEPSCGFA